MMKEKIIQQDLSNEFYISENCYITELLNAAADPDVSIARARVKSGETTRWHRLKGTTERYYIISGRGRVEIGDLPPREVHSGDMVVIPPMCPQRISNTGSADLIFLAICTPRFVEDAYEEMAAHPSAIDSVSFPSWLTQWMDAQNVSLWGGADLCMFATPQDNNGSNFPRAISFAIPMNPDIMAGIQNGPDQDYADEYDKVNKRINALSNALASELKKRGFQSLVLAASVRTDTVNIKGDFPHKTAATRAGLGWIGRNCQLVTRKFGPWVRLGTVFTDMALPCGPSMEKNFCGTCTICVDACPAKALKGNSWSPGLAREALLDVLACDQWKKEHYFQYHNGHNCGICSAVCPYGLKGRGNR
ncbi:4Fe-4S double cluster binding domain-containing protein [Desulfocicer niacini]